MLADDRAGRWLHGHVQNPGLLSFEKGPGTAEGAAGAHSGYQGVDPTFGVGPYFRAGGFFMDGRVGRILELAGHERARGVLDYFPGPGDGPGHALGPRGQDDLGPQHGHDFAPFHTHGLGHGDDQPIAPGGGHRGQGDAGIAAGGFHYGRAGLDQSPLLGVPDQGRTQPALDRIGRVAAFDFGVDRGLGADDMVEPD